MLKLLIGTDWVANRDTVLQRISEDVVAKKGKRILIVPEFISHDMERKLCKTAGDTACRFAEVLPFSRLVGRVSQWVGQGLPACLDNGGRIVAMASAARQLHSKLKAYASVETNPEFLNGLISAVDEFKQCCITPRDLENASKQAEGSFAQKLEELSLLYSTYDAICAQGKRDPADQMTWLLQELEDSDFAQSCVFYIDGFPDFTRQHMAILEHLICNAQEVVISLNCDSIGSSDMRFEKAGATAGYLMRFAKDNGVAVEVTEIAPRSNLLSQVTQRLFQGSTDISEEAKNRLEVYHTETVYQECIATAQQIMTLVRGGARYRDIGIVCGNISAYEYPISMVFHRAGIPFYLSGTENILEKSVISTVLSAIDAAIGGLEQRDVLRYLKSVLSPMDADLSNQVENYAYVWSVSGSGWLKEWTKHPDGLSGKWTEKIQNQLKELNCEKDKALRPLVQLREGFRNAINLKGQVEAIYRFLEEIEVYGRMEDIAAELEQAGDGRNAQMIGQLWEILISALEQLYDVLGQSVWDADTFTRLLKLLLCQYKVGSIPTVLDSVTMGPVSAMRCQQVKYLFAVCVREGELPQYAAGDGVLTQQERDALRKLGVPLTGSSIDSIRNEFSEIYGALSGADEKLFISVSAGHPSFLYRRLSNMAGDKEYPVSAGIALTNGLDASAYLLRNNKTDAAEKMGLTHLVNDLQKKSMHSLGDVAFDTVRKLYGPELRLSASQIDKQADCRLSYFLNYGLKAKERKKAVVDPAEFGTYIHNVLEKTGRKIMELGGFKCVSLEDTLKIAAEYSESYANEHFADIDSQRLTYLFNRNRRELDMVVQEVWEELRESEFVPVDFEVSFGIGGKQDFIPIVGSKMTGKLRGFVDRVDAYRENGQNYFRIVDYKTGKKTFDYCDVLNGLGLQMLLYLFALEDSGEELLGDNPIPAGVQYFPARAPMISTESALSGEEAVAERLGYWKRQGLLLKDDSVLSAMSCEERMSYSKKKDGSLSGDLADREQFRLLKAYVFALLGKMVDEIASGRIAPNPYTRGSSHNACTFCPYGEVCHPQCVEERRNYAAVKADRFWEEIGKEMNPHG